MISVSLKNYILLIGLDLFDISNKEKNRKIMVIYFYPDPELLISWNRKAFVQHHLLAMLKKHLYNIQPRDH